MPKIVTWENGQRVVREARAGELPPAPGWEDLRAQAAALVHRHLDATARARGYDSALSAVSYLGSTNALWAAEAAAFRDWRDDVWEAVFALTPETAPATPEALLAALPELTWPEGRP